MPCDKTGEQLKLSVVMPVYNEANTIEEILRLVRAVPIPKEIIVVDDGSTDGTRDILKAMPDDGMTRVIFHDRNQGKGAAVCTGFKHVRGEIVIIQDADLEYYPSEYSRLLEPIEQGKADVVYGSRFTGPRRVFMYSHYLGNKVINFVANVLFNTTLSDLETCYKAFRATVLRGMKLKSRSFGFEAEFTARVFQKRLRVYEVPISYAGRTYAEGKKITWKDGFIALYWLLRCKFRPLDLGQETLARMAVLQRYSRWLFEKIKPYVGARVFEVGSGVGNITQYLLRHERVVASDISEEYLTLLRSRFGHISRVKLVHYDVTQPVGPELVAERFDTVLFLNVLEHLENDAAALRNLRPLLPPGGRLVLLVPAHQCLFGSLDRNLHHFRRYDRGTLSELLTAAGFQIESVFSFNTLGALGWFVNSRILRRRTLPRFQLGFMDRTTVLVKLIDRLSSWGLSLVAVATPEPE